MNQPQHPTDLDLGRGWLNRAAEMLDSCEDHVSDAEFARAAAAIGSGFIALAAAEREAAAQAFVDERHAAERAEDLERIAANRTEDLERIAAADAKAWEHQDSEAEVRTAVVEAHRAMTARMNAEQAEIEQRTEALAALDVAGLAAAGQREQRAVAEARPHDDELTAFGVGSLSEAIALALGDAYAGVEFEDPTFERGTEAVMAVLQERADRQPKHALDDSLIWVVADKGGPIHAGTQAAAQKWADENRDDYEGLTVTTMEVDRG